jgi:hypothetical protein
MYKYNYCTIDIRTDNTTENVMRILKIALACPFAYSFTSSEEAPEKVAASD